MLKYDQVLLELETAVGRQLNRQVIDLSRKECGGFIDGDGLVGSNSVSAISVIGYGYLLEGTRYYLDKNLLDRILKAADFARRSRRPSGNFDLLSTNFDSAPDTAFIVKSLAPVVKLARRNHSDSGANAISETLGELIISGAEGMVVGGFHTPNHRWVLVAALALTKKLFPDIKLEETIEKYLAETIDVNDDGEYIERSTGVYNAIVNRSLIFAAEALDRPELLDPVRKNLDLSYHLLHGDATVVNSISLRQDRGKRSVPNGLADGYHALSHIDGNGFYAAVADWLIAKGRNSLVCLTNFALNPKWREEIVDRQSLPESYSRSYPDSGLWRVRRKDLSATVASGLTSPFSLVCGSLELSVKMCSSYFATGQFKGEQFQGELGKVKMKHLGRNEIYTEKDYRGGVYWLPIDEEVSAENWREVRGRREIYQLPALEVDLTVVEVENGFDLKIGTVGGLEGVPFQVEFNFTPGGILESGDLIVQGLSGSTVFLKEGVSVYRHNDQAISVGSGAIGHTTWNMRNSEIDHSLFRLLITDITPLQRSIQIRGGRWCPLEQVVKPF